MSPLFEELDYRVTPIGALSLRRRRDLQLGVDVLEIKLGDEFLMTSYFTASEIALATLGLAACDGAQLEVLVGGLGLGYTAQAVLAEPRLASLTVIEMLEPVIAWHESGLLPLGAELTGDPRCRIMQGDFFALANAASGFDAAVPGGASMPFWSTSIIPPTRCSMRAAQASTGRKVLPRWPGISSPAACLDCGRTTNPIPPSRRGSPACSPRPGPSR